MLSSHDEELSDHARTFSDVLLDKLGTRDTDETAVGVVGDGTGEQGLTGTGGP